MEATEQQEARKGLSTGGTKVLIRKEGDELIVSLLDGVEVARVKDIQALNDAGYKLEDDAGSEATPPAQPEVPTGDAAPDTEKAPEGDDKKPEGEAA